MALDESGCYRALSARDPRFDGRFFVAVLTTGIYCRPICPARTPHRRNVRFYPSAAAASEAGFRPCLRCRPESAPGTPAWRGTSATVTRALRLLGEGALDAAGVETLAERLGIGERHLRRLFREHLGASPVAVAQTRRLHFAKKLIDETRLPMTEVAFAAGYASVRRFNAAVRASYGAPPSQLRRRRSHDAGAPPATTDTAAGTLELQLAYRRPLALGPLLEFLSSRAIPGAERVSVGCYRRSIEVDGVQAILEVTRSPHRDALVLRVPCEISRSLASVVDGVRRIFDLDADPVEIRGLLSRDPLLAPVLRRSPGLRVPGAWDGFELAVRTILGQQVSVARASALAGALVRTFGKPLAGPDPTAGLTHLFPAPGRLANVDVASVGLPRQRAEAIRALALAVHERRIQLAPGRDPERVRAELMALPGVGPWTAAYVAMRALREPDAFPAGDLILRRIASEAGAPLSERALEERSQAWRPWRAYAAMALWRASGN